uniref:Uncharacterized protein n=1 Tax=Acrobeloides nanus TaxID=290746 RepID=A0A914CSR8_9BILA
MFIRGSKESPNFSLFQVVPDNSVSILWQLPQYVVVTFAEMLFAISAQEFAYTQAPRSMKSVVFSLYLLTVALGDCIIIAIAALNVFKDLAIQNLVYAGGMFIVITIFMVLSIFYKYKHYDEEDVEENENVQKEDNFLES